jgi:hypothetical protein
MLKLLYLSEIENFAVPFIINDSVIKGKSDLKQ